MKYKVIEDYDRFYLAVHPKGYKECFSKAQHKPNKDGYIIKQLENNYSGGQALPTNKVNKMFGKY